MKRIIITESQFLRLKNHIDKLLITESIKGLTNLINWIGEDLPNFEKKIASENDIPVNKAFNDRMAIPEYSKAGNLKYPLKNGEIWIVNNKKNQEFTKMLDDALESGDFTIVNKRIDDFKSDKTIQDVLKSGPKNTSYNKVAGYIDDLEQRAAETKKNHDNLKQSSKKSSPNPTKTNVLPSFTKEELKQNLDNDIDKVFSSRIEEYNDPSILVDMKSDIIRRFKLSKIYETMLNTNSPMSTIISEVNKEIDKVANSKELELLKPEDRDALKSILSGMKNQVVRYQKEAFWSKKYTMVNGKKIISIPKTSVSILTLIIALLGITEGIVRLSGGDFKPITWMIYNVFSIDKAKQDILDLLKDEDSSINLDNKPIPVYGSTDAVDNSYLKNLETDNLIYSTKNKILTIEEGIKLNGVVYKTFKWDELRKQLSVVLPMPTSTFENSLDGFKKWFTTPQNEGGYGQEFQEGEKPNGVKDTFTITFPDGQTETFTYKNGGFE